MKKLLFALAICALTSCADTKMGIHRKSPKNSSFSLNTWGCGAKN